MRLKSDIRALSWRVNRFNICPALDKLNKEINAALADPKIKARFADLGGTVFPTSPADFGKFIADETEKWGKVVRADNIKAG